MKGSWSIVLRFSSCLSVCDSSILSLLVGSVSRRVRRVSVTYIGELPYLWHALNGLVCLQDLRDLRFDVLHGVVPQCANFREFGSAVPGPSTRILLAPGFQEQNLVLG
jgi:hypothetical protein